MIDTSQHGEATLLRELLPTHFPHYLVEIGAGDGKHLSNSHPFLGEDWQGILIEPHPALFAELSQLYAGNPRVTCVQAACRECEGEGKLFLGAKGNLDLSTLCTDENAWFDVSRSTESIPVVCHRLTTILLREHCPEDFSLLLIDTEGMDYEVLLGLDFRRFTPRVIVTEDYPHDAPKHERKMRLLQERGYRFHTQIGCNAVWLRERKIS